MAFPDDYKRVQQPGSSTAVVEATVYLARQLAVNTDSWTLLVGDGSTPGGWRILMEANFNNFMQGNAPFGTKAYIEAGTDGLTPEQARLWKASELTATFAKIVDITTPSAWFIKDAAMPDVLRAYSKSLGDANNALVSGFYRFDPASASNMPAGIPSSGPWHMMIVNAMSSQNTQQTLYLRDGSGDIFTRSQTDGVWQAWVQATGITLTDLNTRVAKAGDTMTGQLTLKTGNAASAPLKMLDGVAPTTPADGDIWRQDSTGGLIFRKGAVNRTIRDSQNSAIAIIADQKSNVSGGGTAVPFVWTPREINTELYDPENIVTISSNQFTPAFDCEIDWNCIFFAVEYAKTRLFNVTDATIASHGNTGYSNSSGSPATTLSIGMGVALAGKAYRIEYYTGAAGSVQALGLTTLGATLSPATYLMATLRRL